MCMLIAHWVNSIELEVYILMLNLKITTPSPLGEGWDEGNNIISHLY